MFKNIFKEENPNYHFNCQWTVDFPPSVHSHVGFRDELLYMSLLLLWNLSLTPVHDASNTFVLHVILSRSVIDK